MKTSFLMIVGSFLVMSPAYAFEPSYTNYFSNPEYEISSIQYKHHIFFVPYKMLGGQLTDISVDCPSQTLVVSLSQAGTEGDLVLNIPHALFDAPENGNSFFFIIDGKEVKSEEIDSDFDSRTFHIPLPPDAEILEIIYPSARMLPQPISCGIGGDDKSPYYRLLSPLKQFKSGIDPWDVKCNDRLTLLTHPLVDKPYCVTGDTTVKLLERHWKLVVSRGE